MLDDPLNSVDHCYVTGHIKGALACSPCVNAALEYGQKI